MERDINILKSEFDLQKTKVHILVRNAVEKHEIDLTNKILNDKNRGIKIWMHIDNLKNREIYNQQSFNIYNENGDMIEKLNLKKRKLITFGI